MATDPTQARRTIGAVGVGAAALAWWPAFTLGTWGAVFFEQVLALWAASTAAFVMVVLKEGVRSLPAAVTATLLLPSLWIGLSFLPVPDGTVLSEAISWFGAGITLVGLPFMLWVLLMVTRPDVVEVVSARTWTVAGLAVALVALASFGLGRLHPQFLTCDDFRISGNDVPATCTPGEASLG